MQRLPAVGSPVGRASTRGSRRERLSPYTSDVVLNLGDRLRTLLRGRRSTAGLDIVKPQDPGYERVRHVYMATGSPAAVVRVRTSAEVPAALAYALTQEGPFAVRSGGHGISSIATNIGGTVIDLARLNDIELLGGRRVRIGAGARWGQVADALHPHGLAISSGDSGDVGVGGLATTGGIGLLGRKYGLTIDHLVAAEIITADGTTRRVSAADEPDLFWAIRGAGANFGIVTAFEFDAAPASTVGQGLFMYRPNDLPGFLEEWGQTVERAPREISAFLDLDGPIASATVACAADDPTSTTAAMKPFTTLPGLASSEVSTVPYPRLPVTTGDIHRGQQPARARTGLATHLDRDTARRIADYAGEIEMVQIRSVGGAINDVPADATAYAHRHQNFSVTAVSYAERSALDAAWAPVRACMDGLYLSFESDHTPASVSEAFPEPTLTRLRALKEKWDPDRIFTQNFDLGTGS